MMQHRTTDGVPGCVTKRNGYPCVSQAPRMGDPRICMMCHKYADGCASTVHEAQPIDMLRRLNYTCQKCCMDQEETASTALIPFMRAQE
jgi:hypothetical protein